MVNFIFVTSKRKVLFLAAEIDCVRALEPRSIDSMHSACFQLFWQLSDQQTHKFRTNLVIAKRKHERSLWMRPSYIPKMPGVVISYP